MKDKKNILFLSQSKTLSVFYDIAKNIKKQNKLNKCGMYISSADYYRQFINLNKSFTNEDFIIETEWSIIKNASNVKINQKKLEKFESYFNNDILWNSITADRNISMGKNSRISQSYSFYRSEKELTSIIQTGIFYLENLFDKLKPDLVVSFICVSFGEYLCHLIAKKRGIKQLNLRSARVRNYFIGSPSIHEPCPMLEQEFSNELNNNIESYDKNFAKTFLNDFRSSKMVYEGAPKNVEDQK